MKKNRSGKIDWWLTVAAVCAVVMGGFVFYTGCSLWTWDLAMQAETNT